MPKSCHGNCSGCSGCAKELELTQPEIDMLCALGQIPFLPVARRKEDFIPIYLEDTAYPPETYSLVLQVLERKNLISLDYGTPLPGADMAAYKAYPVHGSFALTQRGQAVLEKLEIEGIQ